MTDALVEPLEAPDGVRAAFRTTLEDAGVVEHRYGQADPGPGSDAAHDEPAVVSVVATDSGVRVDDDDTHRYATPDAVVDHHAPLVTDWFYWERTVGGHGTPERAFLRWLEGVDVADQTIAKRYDDLWKGLCRTWGQLTVCVERDRTGNRRYELRHVEDAAVEPDALRQIDPFDLPELARTDEDGDYRPLRGSETLQRGWRLRLDAGGVVRAVDDVYPASIATWYRDRTDRLEPVSFRETAARQTGHLRSLADASRTDVAAVVRDRCSDCLKRRVWEFEGSDSDRVSAESTRDDRLVCPEACALVRSDVRCRVVDDDGPDHDHGHDDESETSDSDRSDAFS
ncbi:DR2241 family protein [Natribaculum luteum]|uniref:DR2241 family protein n=1 Tax=Natribaculum luteum TaxID=1586232 RepID=A0ABD5P5W8_9EURY|nr:DR2241 family protein [Natribaculum luteum]